MIIDGTGERTIYPRTVIALIMILLSGAAYVALHLWTVSWFPFIHSDEAWLASLSRTIWLERNLGATEEFLRLTPRHPHALKSVYHLVQAPFVVQWWGPVAARIPSLLAGVTAVCFVAAILRRLTGSFIITFLMTAAFALDTQFFYISHLARQEALIMCALLCAVLILIRKNGKHGTTLAASIIGAAIFVHPNAFIAAAAALPWLVYTGRARRGGRAAVRYVGILTGFAILAVSVSLILNPRFIADYWEFGRSVGVTSGFLERFARLREFLVKIARRHAGTYYLAPFAVQLWTLAVVSLAAGLYALLGPRTASRFTPLLAVSSAVATTASLFVIGKYSPPSIVFLLPWLYITIGLLAGSDLFRVHTITEKRLKHTMMIIVLAVVPVLSGFQLAREMSRWYPDEYATYLERVRAPIPEGEIVLANLNTAFAFQPGELRVWRDLGALPPVTELPAIPTDDIVLNRPLAQFLQAENAGWVVLSVEELDMIYRERPVWNEMYGNPHRFYPDLLYLLDRFGTRVDRFVGGRYAMRHVPFMERGPYHVEIYRLELP